MRSKIFIFLILFISINSFEFIKYLEENEIAIITLSRPKALNALNSKSPR